MDPNIARPQRVWLVRSTIEDGRREWRQDRRKPPAHERLAVVVHDHMGLRTTSPSYMLNCIAPETAVPVPDVEARSAEELQAWAYEQITERQLDRVKAVRAGECDLRREYLNTAFTDLILELQEELNGSMERTALRAIRFWSLPIWHVAHRHRAHFCTQARAVGTVFLCDCRVPTSHHR